ncbi:MAG: zinc-binding dehydrogenase [Stellaceae bacterium]
MDARFGATHAIHASEGDVVERVRAISGGLGVDTAFDAIGSEQTALQVIDALAPGGHAVLVGIPAFATRAGINLSQMVYGEKAISGTYYGSVRPNVDFPILADLDLQKKINLDDLISRTYRFDEVNEGFRAMLAGEVARGVIVFD